MTCSAAKIKLGLTSRRFACDQIRHASRITKFKNPFIGGRYRKIQLPYAPPGRDEYAAESLRPSIPPEYPEGVWGKISREKAWEFHRRKLELLEKGSVRSRLENLTVPKSKENMKRWHVNMDGNLPYAFPFLQYVTKSELHLSLPYNEDPVPDDAARLAKRAVDELALLGAKGATPEDRVSAVVDFVKRELLRSSDVSHLDDAQIDRDNVFEAGWRRSGFEEDDMEDERAKTKIWSRRWGAYLPVGEYKHLDPGIINFQIRSSPFMTLRCKSPMTSAEGMTQTDSKTGCPPFVHSWVTHDDNGVPLYAYHPSAFGFTSKVVPPSLNPGYKLPPVKTLNWVHRPSQRPRKWLRVSERNRLSRVFMAYVPEMHGGVEVDPAQFPHTAFLLPVSAEELEARGFSAFDEEQSYQWDAERALACLFAWNVASAHHQGFNPYLDLTYPIRSQAVVTDGVTWRFFVHQTNTLELWRDDDAFRVKNSLWTSRRLDWREEPDTILSLLSNALSQRTRTEMSTEEMKPYITKSDEVAEVVRPKYDFEMKVL